MPAPFRMILTVRPLESGGVDATHEFASPQDARAAALLPGQGITHIAHGLLLEALRREMYLQALIKLTQDGEYLKGYVEADEDRRRAMEGELVESAVEVFRRGAEKLGPGTAQGVLEMLKAGMGAVRAP